MFRRPSSFEQACWAEIPEHGEHLFSSHQPPRTKANTDTGPVHVASVTSTARLMAAKQGNGWNAAVQEGNQFCAKTKSRRNETTVHQEPFRLQAWHTKTSRFHLYRKGLGGLGFFMISFLRILFTQVHLPSSSFLVIFVRSNELNNRGKDWNTWDGQWRLW